MKGVSGHSWVLPLRVQHVIQSGQLSLVRAPGSVLKCDGLYLCPSCRTPQTSCRAGAPRKTHLWNWRLHRNLCCGHGRQAGPLRRKHKLADLKGFSGDWPGSGQLSPESVENAVVEHWDNDGDLCPFLSARWAPVSDDGRRSLLSATWPPHPSGSDCSA
ncbi:hypothetical protein AAFF_G00301880 [Aldrovandia affinis]|uniref:Uncharacterized protein n=1 Tax=Aldrovandia affinis TaxID=143900 RepID=A0AAD7SPP9_9TELE|nr:hypothetical protein AAFF_G00301880 [Aldrovandia affinis]